MRKIETIKNYFLMKKVLRKHYNKSSTNYKNEKKIYLQAFSIIKAVIFERLYSKAKSNYLLKKSYNLTQNNCNLY